MLFLGFVIKIIRFKTRFGGKFKVFKSTKALPLVKLKHLFCKNRQFLSDGFLEHLS